MDKLRSASTSRSGYAARGRVYGGLTHEQLAERWIAAFSAIVRAPGRDDLRSDERELSAEFKLRKIDPPYRDVQEDRERLIAQISEQLEVLRTSLPHDFELLQAASVELTPLQEPPGAIRDAGGDTLDASRSKLTAPALPQLSSMEQRDNYLVSPRRDH
jgi:hypothetical protein